MRTRRKIATFLVVCLTCCAVALAVPAYVQSAKGQCGSAASCTGTFTTANLTTGNLIFVGISAPSSGTTLSSLTDTTTAGNVFTNVVTKFQNGVASGAQWTGYVPNITGGAKDAIKATWNTTLSFSNTFIIEISGVATSSVVDGTPTTKNDGGTPGTAISCNPITTTNANDIIVVFVDTTGSSGLTAGSGYTPAANASANNTAIEYQVVSSTGTYTPTMTGAGSANWTCSAIAFSSNPISSSHTQPVFIIQ